jgi:hypothetical protein
VHESHGKRWVGLPKPQVGRDGVARRDQSTNKILYSPVIEFVDKPTRDAFSARAVAALLENFPNVFDGEAVS